MATQNPQRIELGEMLKRYRERAGMSPRDVESALRWGVAKATRVEAGTRILAHAEVVNLAELYNLSPDESATLQLLADAARRRESSARVADYAQTYVTLERAATAIDYFDAVLIHSLVQTERYARAVLQTGGHDQQDIAAGRIARQAILADENPPVVRILLGEGALYQQVGGPDVLHEQLAHLLEVTRLPHVSVRILPYTAGAHLALGVGFTVLSLANPTITRVYIEGLTDATYIQDPDETEVYTKGFASMWRAAPGDQESATILRRHIT